MKVAIVGKGGVGKTTVTAALTRALADTGRSVYAIDADPSNCLAYALGLPTEIAERIKPLSDMRDLLAERAGSRAGQGGMFILNPQVADIIDEHTVTHDGIRLLVMGTIETGGAGCACPESNTLRALVRELVDLPDEIILDMEAGLEHLGRGTAGAVDGLIGVVTPDGASVRTVKRIKGLAADIGLKRLAVIVNRVQSPGDVEAVRRDLGDIPVAAELKLYAGLASDDTLSGEAGCQLLADLQAQLPDIERAMQK